VIKPSQTFAPQQVRQAVAALLELGIGHAFAGTDHHESGPIGMLTVSIASVHVQPPVSEAFPAGHAPSLLDAAGPADALARTLAIVERPLLG
jgi:hypothetical protein